MRNLKKVVQIDFLLHTTLKSHRKASCLYTTPTKTYSFNTIFNGSATSYTGINFMSLLVFFHNTPL